MVLSTSSVAFIFVATSITICIAIIVLYTKWKFLYWVRVGLPILHPTFFFGNMKDILLGRCSEGDFYYECYKKFKSNGFKHGGVYMFLHPVYVPTDLKIIKHILKNDFEHFTNRTTYLNEEGDPLSENMFRMHDDKWKNLRTKLTRNFSPNKLNLMFPSLLDCAEDLKIVVDEAVIKRVPVDVKEVLGRFCVDVFGETALGLQWEVLKNPQSDINNYCKNFFDSNGFRMMKIMLAEILPKSLLCAIKFKLAGTDLEQFFIKLIDRVINYREKNNTRREDFLQLLLEMKNNSSVHEKPLNLNQVTAQVFAFFLAVFEAPSSMITFALYELANNFKIQEKVKEEINSVLSKHGGQLTYKTIAEMKYLDKVLQETVRKHPVGRILQRKCNSDYTIPNTSIRLKKGVSVKISIVGVHYDPEYYPNPEKFDPEHFSDQNKKERPDIAWLGFGKGQRMCLGLRFAIVLGKLALCVLLENYKVTLNTKTKVPIQLDVKKFFSYAEGGVWLDFEKV
ncbi:hypothetical protein Zmor_009893 [Zophobas morio]|uniref:Cytochrome P450 n=1 Tax=Zophobas morio TaxID=2755281 RepID=A0AA38IM57_9CUCU|nr:hypothetical protein Zmor_009893 [Zophobas morio]